MMPTAMDIRCPVCSSADLDLRGDYRASHATFAGLRLAHCRSCGMVAAVPMPELEALERYNASYFDMAHGGKPDSPSVAAFFSGMAHLRVFHIERYLAARGLSVGSVLEWGGGPGFFVGNWLRRHAGNRYMVVETDTSCHASLARAGATVVDPRQVATQHPVDLVVMSHVVEHVPRPLDFVREGTRLLQPGGTLFIEVPCRDWEHKDLDEPHLLFFDKDPMRRMLENLGFEDIDVSYHGELIANLRSPSALRRCLLGVRARLITLGMVAPFAGRSEGLDILSDALERAAVSPFKAHRESSDPAWWLRAIARKSRS